MITIKAFVIPRTEVAEPVKQDIYCQDQIEMVCDEKVDFHSDCENSITRTKYLKVHIVIFIFINIHVLINPIHFIIFQFIYLFLFLLFLLLVF